MQENQIVAQLYSVRDYLETPADIEKSLKKIRKIGFKTVQISGLGPLSAEDWARLLKDTGLHCIASHEPGDEILTQPEMIADRLSKLDCGYTAFPYPLGISFDDIRSVKKFTKSLNKAGRIIRNAGKALAYHNHDIEFMKIGDKTVLDIIYDETEPECLVGELDTYWVQAGGGSTIAWCRKLKNRLPLLHLKDYGMAANRKPVFKEIGEGNLDWKGIIEQATNSGCQWFIVEQDQNWIDDDPFKSLKTSFQYLKKNFCNKVSRL